MVDRFSIEGYRVDSMRSSLNGSDNRDFYFGYVFGSWWNVVSEDNVLIGRYMLEIDFMGNGRGFTSSSYISLLVNE